MAGNFICGFLSFGAGEAVGPLSNRPVFMPAGAKPPANIPKLDLEAEVAKVPPVAPTAEAAPVPVTSPYQVHIDPITGRGPMGIDTSGFTSGESTMNGGLRNAKQFWRAWATRYQSTLSDNNLAAIARGRSPVVDEHWIKSFPEAAPYSGETLIHHHLDYGPTAYPLPESVHGQQPGWGIWHEEHAGGN